MGPRRTLAIGTILMLVVAACSSDDASPILGDPPGTGPVPTASSSPTPATSTAAPEQSSIPETLAPETSTIPETSAPETSMIPTTSVAVPTTGATESTSALEPVQPTEVWSLTQVDAELPSGQDFWIELSVVVLPDGRPRVIYGTGTSLRMVTCVDVSCSAVETVEVLDAAPLPAGNLWVSAALRGDGSPVIVTTNGGGATPAEKLVVWCDDPECGSVTTAVLPGENRYLDPWLATSPDGRVGVFDVVSLEPALGPPGDRFVAFTYCDDPGCLDDPAKLTELRPVSADEFSFFGRAVGGFDAAGLPVALHAGHPRSKAGAELAVVACGDPECATVSAPQIVAEATGFALRTPMAVPGGGLALLFQRYDGGPDVEWQGVTTSFIACADTTCADRSATAELRRSEVGGGDGTPFSGALGPDGFVRLVLTTVEGFEFTTCDDADCTSFTTSDLVPHRAHQIGLVVGGDGATVVATADSRPPDEPNIVPGVWLLRCDDRQCLPPEPAS